MDGNGKETTAQLVLTKSTDDGKHGRSHQYHPTGKGSVMEFPPARTGYGNHHGRRNTGFPIQYIDADRIRMRESCIAKIEEGGPFTTGSFNTTESQVAEIEPGFNAQHAG